LNRAVSLANSTIDACIWIDYVDISLGDTINWTISFAITTSDTCIQYFSWHYDYLLLSDLLTVYIVSMKMHFVNNKIDFFVKQKQIILHKTAYFDTIVSVKHKE